MTAHVPAVARVTFALVMVHPVLVVAKVIAPEPDPPAVVRAIALPAVAVLVVFATVRVVCMIAQVKVTGALVFEAYVVSPTVELALVAVTAQVPMVERLTLVPERVQPAVVVANVTSPVPDPPLLVSVMVVAATTVSVDDVMVSAACAVANVNVTEVLVDET